jgi:hypothetical protein
VLQRNIYGLVNQVLVRAGTESPGRTGGGINGCEGMTLGHALTKNVDSTGIELQIQ